MSQAQLIDHDRDEAVALALHAARSPRAFGGDVGADEHLAGLQSKWEQGGTDVSLQPGGKSSPNRLTLSKIVVPQSQRGQGIGHSVMSELTDHADRYGRTLALTPSKDFGASSVGRLKNFYGQHGFVENRGRNKDFGISESMYRVPVPRVAKAAGGGFHPPHFHIPKPVRTHVGPINSSVAGRTDHLPMTVPSGSYVVPADVVGHLGAGNTIAGFKVLRRVFGGQPYGGGTTPYAQGSGPYGSRANGGKVGAVPIVGAGGEHVLSPEQVLWAGGGDMEAGHKALDEFVKRTRAESIKVLKNLPGPSQS